MRRSVALQFLPCRQVLGILAIRAGDSRQGLSLGICHRLHAFRALDGFRVPHKKQSHSTERAATGGENCEELYRGVTAVAVTIITVHSDKFFGPHAHTPRSTVHHFSMSLAHTGHSLVGFLGTTLKSGHNREVPMVDQKTALAELVRAFPQLSTSDAWENSGNHDRQWYEFARLVSDLYDRGRRQYLRIAFDELERFLVEGNSYVRGWVTGFLQFLQDVTSWSSPNSDAFMDFLGPKSLRLWKTLDAIRSDLADCPILEAEILMWRVAHHEDPNQSTPPRDPFLPV
jgi:hypothetical protein